MSAETTNDIIDGPTELPKDDMVDTEFGPMVVRFMIDGDNPTIALDANANGAYITVNCVNVAVVMTLTDYGNGFEPRKDEHGRTHSALYTTRMNPKGGKGGSIGSYDVSGAAKRKLLDTLPGVAREWAVGKEGILIEARRASAYCAIRNLRAKLETAQETVEDLQVQIGAAEDRYCEIPGHVQARIRPRTTD